MAYNGGRGGFGRGGYNGRGNFGGRGGFGGGQNRNYDNYKEPRMNSMNRDNQPAKAPGPHEAMLGYNWV